MQFTFEKKSKELFLVEMMVSVVAVDHLSIMIMVIFFFFVFCFAFRLWKHYRNGFILPRNFSNHFDYQSILIGFFWIDF